MSSSAKAPPEYTQVFSADYLRSPKVRKELDSLLGEGKYTLKWRLDQWQLKAERRLNENEKKRLKTHFMAITAEAEPEPIPLEEEDEQTPDNKATEPVAPKEPLEPAAHEEGSPRSDAEETGVRATSAETIEGKIGA